MRRRRSALASRSKRIAHRAALGIIETLAHRGGGGGSGRGGGVIIAAATIA